MKISKIVKRYYAIGLLFTGVIIFNGCDVAGDIIGNATVAKLEGEWACDEQSEIFKKATASTYAVYISADPDDPNGVIIDNFYGVDAPAKASVVAMSLSISEQTIDGGFTVSGSGIIAGGYQEISLTYTVDDGSGVVDHVTAVYTKN